MFVKRDQEYQDYEMKSVKSDFQHQQLLFLLVYSYWYGFFSSETLNLFSILVFS